MELTYKHLELAYKIAMDAHAGQKYGNRDYYFAHVCVVEDKVRELFGNCFKLRIVALQHDNLEDSDKYTIENMVDYFGTEVADAIVAIIKVEGESRNNYIKRVKRNELALKVKICDTICNLEASMKIQDSIRIVRYSEQLASLYK
jgi:(p)ppGpp synthase/HD superfamily hydrolase